MPAVERYDGPDFRLLRRYLRTEPTDPPAIYVVSAECGLIPRDHPLSLYDRRMTVERANELRPGVLKALERLLSSGYNDVFVGVGRDYRAALDGWTRLISAGTLIYVAEGSRGRRIFELRRWLYGATLPPNEPTAQAGGKVRLRGVTLDLTPERVYAAARRALVAGQGKPGRFHGWFVLVDEQPVGIKWLACVLTGLPVSAFGASEARRVLLALGVEVKSR